MPLSSSIRARAYRQRLARGGRVVALEVGADDVAALIAAGLLVASPGGYELEDVARAIAKLLAGLPSPAVPVPAPPRQRFASVVVPGLSGQRRRG